MSLDENEISHFRLILEEVFGEQNFLVQIIVQSNKRGQTYKQIAKTHEYLICFGKTAEAKLGELETEGSNLPEQDDVGRYSSRELRNRNPKFGKHNRPNLFYPIFANPSFLDSQGNFPVSIDEQPGWVKILPYNSLGIESCWRWGNIKVANNTQSNSTSVLYAKQTREGGWRVFEKYRKETVKAKSIWLDTKHISEQGTTELGRLGLSDSFQFPKPVGVLEDCLMLATDDNSIILDSFAGSGTTAHAVLKRNAQDKGNRRFILIEMMDYAETLTAERVRRVMSGYGEGARQFTGLGGSFDYYTVGEPIFNDDDALNEVVGIEVIRNYVAYSEGIPPENRTLQDNDYTPYLMGLNSDTAWIFYYDPNEVTCLDLDFLSALKFGSAKPGTAIIYADKCLLTKEFMTKQGVIFKKIPRDITRF